MKCVGWVWFLECCVVEAYVWWVVDMVVCMIVWGVECVVGVRWGGGGVVGWIRKVCVGCVL